MGNSTFTRMSMPALLLIVANSWAVQSSSQPPKQNPPQQQQSGGQNQPPQGNQPNQNQPANAPAPLFEGKSTLKSSRQGKETATAGFNGIGPDGSVQSSVLNSSPSPADAQHVAAMASTNSDPSELAAFTKEGNLHSPKQQ